MILTQTEWDVIFEATCKEALSLYGEDGHAVALILAIRDGVTGFIPLSNQMLEIPRDALRDILRSSLKALGANAYFMVNEGWATENELRSARLPPSLDPAKFEVLMVTGVFPEHKRLRVYHIDQGKVLDTLRNVDSRTGPWQNFSIFCDLLDESGGD